MLKWLKVVHHKMSVVGKSTCSGVKTGLYISYHGGNAVRYIKQGSYEKKNSAAKVHPKYVKC